MANQFSTTVRNARADAYESTIGSAPLLQLRTGAPPADCAAADSGAVLAEITLPADWMAAASAGAKAKSGTWSGTGVAAGTAAHFRLQSSGGTTHHQGTVTATGGGGDMTLDNAVIAIGQAVSITGFSFTEGGA